MVRAAGIEPASHAWEAHIIASILRPRTRALKKSQPASRRNVKNRCTPRGTAPRPKELFSTQVGFRGATTVASPRTSVPTGQLAAKSAQPPRERTPSASTTRIFLCRPRSKLTEDGDFQGAKRPSIGARSKKSPVHGRLRVGAPISIIPPTILSSLRPKPHDLGRSDEGPRGRP